MNDVWHIENVNDETLLTGEYDGHIELVNKKNMTCLSLLTLESNRIH